MKENFDRCIKFILKHEGGYVNHPDDPGGETKFGISKRAFPRVDIKNLTEQHAAEIYKEFYWNRVGGDDLPDGMDLVIFDTAVNMGVGRAIQIAEGAADHHEYICRRMAYYAALTRRNPKLKTFLAGWINRLTDLYNEVS